MAQEMTDERPFRHLIFTIPFPHTKIYTGKWMVYMHVHVQTFVYTQRSCSHKGHLRISSNRASNIPRYTDIHHV